MTGCPSARASSDTVPFGFYYPGVPASQLDAHGGLAGLQVDARGIDPNMNPSSTLNYSLGVEHQLPGRLIAGATYSGSYSWHAINGSYSLPTPSQPWLRAVLGRWEITSVLMLQGGMPFMVVATSAFQPIRDGAGKITGFRPGSGDYNADGFNYDYPNTPSKDFTGSHSRQDFIPGLFTAADFPTPAVGTQCDLKRDIYRCPGLASVDAAMIKNIPARLLGETAKLQLRFEFCNVLNRVNLTNMNGFLTSPSFGRSTSTYDPRIIQLGDRIAF